MVDVYWACLAGGLIFAVVTVILGDLISHAVHGVLDFLSVDFLQPMTIVGGITAFGGAGVLLTEYTVFSAWLIVLLSVLAALIVAIVVYFVYVKPMSNAENSTGFSIRDLTGKIGEVTVTIPATGYGEVLVRIGAANTNQIAASFEHETIQSGTRVVVVEVKDHTLFVARFDH